jgi:outer membrane protein assembly factor BamB
MQRNGLRTGAFVLATTLAAACAGATPSEPGAPVSARTRAGAAASRANDARWSTPTEHEPGPLAADDGGTIVHALETVVALDRDGALRWERHLPDLGTEHPALDDDLVVVSTVTGTDENARGGFVALDRTTGAIRWRVDAAGAPGPVAIVDDAVFTATTNGNVSRLTRDGDLVWTWHDAEVELGISSRGVLAYDADTQRLAFTARLPGGWAVVFLDARAGGVVALLPLDGPGPPSATVAAGNGRFVVGNGGTGHVLLFDAEENVVTWAVPTGAPFDPASVPVVADDVAYAVNAAGAVVALDLEAGRARWRAELHAVVRDVRPVLTADAVVLAPWTGPVTVLARADGRRLPSSAGAAGGVPSGYAVAGDDLVVALRFAAPSGVRAWPAP